jgi:hypothetical protein
MKDNSKALYIKYKGREWCCWQDGSNGLRAIPGDEQEYNEDDLVDLTNYLCEEGFFPEFFDKDDADEVGF